MASTVFEWKEDKPEDCLGQVLSFLKTAEEGLEDRRIPPHELEELVRRVLSDPKGGRGHLRGKNSFREYAYKNSSLLGYAWIGVGKSHLLALRHERTFIPAPWGKYKAVVAEAGRLLQEHLKRARLVPPERVEQVGKLLLGGFNFKPGPEWIATEEEPTIRVPLGHVLFSHLVWEHLDQPKPKALVQNLRSALEKKGIKVKLSLLEEVLEGKASLLETVGLFFLAEYGGS